MSSADYRLHIADLNYGDTCSSCAGPKSRQATECASCYFARRRDDEFWARRTCECGGSKQPSSAHCKPCRDEELRGVPVPGHENRIDHPWRSKRFGRAA